MADAINSRDRSDDEADTPKDPMLGLSVPQLLGGALAASTAAAIGSRLGVAGTVVGAALVSMVAAVGGAVYTRTLRSTSARVSGIVRRPGSGATRVGAGERDAATVEPTKPRFGLRQLLGVAAAVFLLAGLLVTGFEALTGNALSGGRGTTVSQVGSGGGGGGPAERTPTPRATAPQRAGEPSAGPSGRATPGEEPTSPSGQAGEPTQRPTGQAGQSGQSGQSDQSGQSGQSGAEGSGNRNPDSGSGSGSGSNGSSSDGSNGGSGGGSRSGSRSGSGSGSGGSGSSGSDSGS